MSVETIHADILEEFLKLLKNHIPDHVICKIEEELKKEQPTEKSILEILKE